MKLVTIDPRRIELADYGVLHLEPAARHERRGDARARARGARATASSNHDFLTPAPRASTRWSRICCGDYTPEDGRGASPASPPPTSSGRAHLRRGRATPASRGASGVTEHMYGSEVVQADLQPRADDRQGRAARLGAAAAPRAEQRPGLVRHGRAAGHLHRLPLGRRRGGRASLRGALGRVDAARARAEDPARCSTRPSPATSRRCTSSARTSRRPTRTPRTSWRRWSTSSSSSARTSSRTRRRSTRT